MLCGTVDTDINLDEAEIKAVEQIELRGVEWVHGLFLFPLVLGKM